MVLGGEAGGGGVMNAENSGHRGRIGGAGGRKVEEVCKLVLPVEQTYKCFFEVCLWAVCVCGEMCVGGGGGGGMPLQPFLWCVARTGPRWRSLYFSFGELTGVVLSACATVGKS